MWLIFALIIGIIIGFFSKKILFNWIKNMLVVKRHRYKVKFHTYFVVHRSGSQLNEIIRTETVEVAIVAKDEDDVIKLVQEIINDQTRIEFESIDIDNS